MCTYDVAVSPAWAFQVGFMMRASAGCMQTAEAVRRASRSHLSKRCLQRLTLRANAAGMSRSFNLPQCMDPARASASRIG